MPRRPRRTFTAEFKAKGVLDLLAGNTTQAEVCRKHQLSPTRLALWKATLLERLPTVSRPTTAGRPRPTASPIWSGGSASRRWSCPP